MTEDGSLLMYRVSALETKVREQAAELAELEERLAQREAARSEAERKQLIAGIIFLGGIIMSLGGIIWAYRSVIFRGAQ